MTDAEKEGILTGLLVRYVALRILPEHALQPVILRD